MSNERWARVSYVIPKNKKKKKICTVKGKISCSNNLICELFKSRKELTEQKLGRIRSGNFQSVIPKTTGLLDTDRLYGANSRKRAHRIIVSSAKSIFCDLPCIRNRYCRDLEFNGSEIRALKTTRSHERTNQSDIKPNTRGPRNWFTTTVAC